CASNHGRRPPRRWTTKREPGPSDPAAPSWNSRSQTKRLRMMPSFQNCSLSSWNVCRAPWRAVMSK
ncbi:unnamed protein product, partial [Durusdinium trenchii]